MKILLVSDQYYPLGGGIEQYLRGLGRQLTAWRHQVTYLTRTVEGCAEKEMTPEGVVIRTLLLLNAIHTPLATLKRWRQLVLLIEPIKPDVVYANHHTSLGTIKACQHLDIPVVYGCHGVGLLCPLRIRFLKPNDDLCYNERGYLNCLRCFLMLADKKSIFQKVTFLILNIKEIFSVLGKVTRYNKANKILESADKIICNSSLTASFFSEKAIGINLGIDTELYRPVNPSSFKEKHGLSEYIICASRIHNTKGQEYLIQATQYLDENIKLVLAGDEVRKDYPYHKKILELIQELKLENRIVFAGVLEKNELVQAYSGARVSVMPSVWIETYGYVVAESLACGTPVVLTENSGAKEIVDETCGRIVPRKNPKAIAEAVLEIWDKAEKMGKAGREKMVRELNWETTADKVLEVFHTVVKK